MTEPLKPTNYVNIGGVKYNSNDIKNHQTLIKNGAIRYSVFLKNGVNIEYPAQKAQNNASVFRMDTSDELTDTHINNLAYGKVTGSEKSDTIGLHGCNSTTVDVSGDNSRTGDVVSIGDTVKGNYAGDTTPQKKFIPSKNNKIITDKDDAIFIETQNTKVNVEGAGLTTESSLKGVKQK